MSPISPQIIKGALAVYETDDPATQPDIIVFQYNPDQMRRSLAARTPPQEQGQAGNAQQEVLRVAGPPVETINLSVELDAADQLEHPDSNSSVAENGLHPALATLELLMYPPSLNAEEISQLAERGEVQVSPVDLPLTLLVFGKSRVVPVSVTSFAIAEEAYDTRLNPIRAKVDLGLKVLTYLEFPGTSVARDAFISYQKQKEALARQFQNSSDEDRVRKFLPGSTAP